MTKNKKYEQPVFEIMFIVSDDVIMASSGFGDDLIGDNQIEDLLL